MRRRALLTTLGSVGLGGCLRLQTNGGTPTGTPSPEPAASPGDTPSPTTAESAASPTSTPSLDVSLSRRGGIDRDIDYLFPHGQTVYLNGFDGPAAAGPSGELKWTAAKDAENGRAHLGADTFAINKPHAVFGYTADPGADDPLSSAGAHFYAQHTATGERHWVASAPADGRHRHAVDAAIVGETAVVGASDWGSASEQSPVVIGLDVASGEERWRLSTPDLPADFASGVTGHDGLVFVHLGGSGTVVVDPADGAIVDRLEALRVDPHMGGPTRRGERLFARRGADIVAYSLVERSERWAVGDVDRSECRLAADATLVVGGTTNGAVHAIDREEGTRRWDASVPGQVMGVSLSSALVWVANAQTGLFAFARRSGEPILRATYDVGGNDIAVLQETLFIGGEGAVLTIER